MNTLNPRKIRNFSIIAHIDHGKSTLADRLLEVTHTISKREMKEQVLDQMDLERERGITIKAQAVRISYEAKDGEEYILNLIDTPGHVDFTYEVSRSLAACEGALLVVDASQGVEAQTIANASLALNNDLEIIPVLNKIDLPSAEPERVKHEIEESLGIDASYALLVSAKTGQGIDEVLEAIIERIPAPKGSVKAPLKALIFDSVYDSYRGVIIFVRVFDGKIEPGMKIKMMATGKVAEVEEVGVFRPKMTSVSKLSVGEVGYVIAGIKDVKETKAGDTITEEKRPTDKPLAGYKEAKPVVFCGLYPIDGGEYENLRDALDKLKLNDPSFAYEPETSKALGFGFRCGFLGLLHMEIVRERLEREYKLDSLATAPNVVYNVVKINKTSEVISNPANFPSPGEIEKIEEPYVSILILLPPEFVGGIMDLCQEKRGEFKNMQYLSTSRVQLHYHLPLSEMMYGFYDSLKSRTKGYASMDYEHIGYKESDLVKLDILLAGEPVDALSFIVHRDSAYFRGRELVNKLREIIPRQLYDVPIQAAIESKIIARETIKAKRKDVLSKCYGGDITRKRKLLEKQKAGKKRMKNIGSVEVPREAFLAVLKVDKEK
ncbi:translation elongation factor 4 [Candidatus Oleimmundimicrobium sp.]|uniref:translation elongation factor 4 n=1 Tax=Candidatus Oleimmundimicrobium sp. TaxID=3060597 RepID=UPI00271A2FB1|nr:translation elongation factor 4 [Candidatus Oleimmundimicrobium sp.]MDO8885853.1 translation elongation factor 4 [Candidatus Oleimmundimicrobium sp.]